MLETEVEWAYLPKAYGIIRRKIKKEAVMIECAKYHNDVCTMYEWSFSETYLIQPGGWIRGGRRSRKPSTQWWCLHCPERWLGISQEKIRGRGQWEKEWSRQVEHLLEKGWSKQVEQIIWKPSGFHKRISWDFLIV